MKLKQKKQLKIDKINSWFFEKINKIDKPLATLTKRREKTQITKIQNEQGNITIDTSEIQNIIKSYFENLYSNKTENLEDINKFPETYELPKLNQEDMHNLNKSISSNEIEEVIKSLPTKKSLGL